MIIESSERWKRRLKKNRNTEFHQIIHEEKFFSLNPIHCLFLPMIVRIFTWIKCRFSLRIVSLMNNWILISSKIRMMEWNNDGSSKGLHSWNNFSLQLPFDRKKIPWHGCCQYSFDMIDETIFGTRKEDRMIDFEWRFIDCWSNSFLFSRLFNILIWSDENLSIVSKKWIQRFFRNRIYLEDLLDFTIKNEFSSSKKCLKKVIGSKRGPNERSVDSFFIILIDSSFPLVYPFILLNIKGNSSSLTNLFIGNTLNLSHWFHQVKVNLYNEWVILTVLVFSRNCRRNEHFPWWKEIKVDRITIDTSKIGWVLSFIAGK